MKKTMKNLKEEEIEKEIQAEPEVIDVPQKPNAKSTSRTTKIVVYIILGVVIIGILFFTVFGLGIYNFNWKDKFTSRVYHFFPYPSSVVNYKFLSYADYADDIETLTYYYNQQSKTNPDVFSMPTQDKIKELVLERQIKDEYTNQLAKKFKVKASSNEVEAELQKIVDQAGSREAFDSMLKNLYNWEAETFKDKVLYYYLLRLKLQEKIAFDDQINQDNKKRAEEVFALVKKGDEKFEDLAKKYSEDASGPNGGELEPFTKGQMVKEFEEAAFALNVGETSDLVRTQYGFHVIKLEEKIGEGEQTQLRVRHILIRAKDLDTYLNEQIKKARVWVVIPKIKWDKANSTVSSAGLNTNSQPSNANNANSNTNNSNTNNSNTNTNQ
jgi:foldase protein PrsA